MPILLSALPHIEKDAPLMTCHDGAGIGGLTARFTHFVFAIINPSLASITSRKVSPPVDIFVGPQWVPAAGLVSSVGLLALDLAVR